MRQGPWGYNGKEEQQDSSDAQSHTSREAESCLSEREREDASITAAASQSDSECLND